MAQEAPGRLIYGQHPPGFALGKTCLQLAGYGLRSEITRPVRIITGMSEIRIIKVLNEKTVGEFLQPRRGQLEDYNIVIRYVPSDRYFAGLREASRTAYRLRKSAYATSIPSGRRIFAVNPSFFKRETSSSFLGVPSGLVRSKTILPG